MAMQELQGVSFHIHQGAPQVPQVVHILQFENHFANLLKDLFYFPVEISRVSLCNTGGCLKYNQWYVYHSLRTTVNIFLILCRNFSSHLVYHQRAFQVPLVERMPQFKNRCGSFLKKCFNSL